jgi:hypothetical protein
VLFGELIIIAERRQRVVIDKSIQAAQQARGRSERGAVAGALAPLVIVIIMFT